MRFVSCFCTFAAERSLDGSGARTKAVGSTDTACGMACDLLVVFPIFLQCVKALVYYDVQACRLDIGNEKGDTPLHIAARWGYQGIIETLLQNGASTEIQNRLKETPLKCALNSKVALFSSQSISIA